MLSPLAKGESGGCIFLGYPRFHEDKFTTPLPPFLRGILRFTPPWKPHKYNENPIRSTYKREPSGAISPFGRNDKRVRFVQILLNYHVNILCNLSIIVLRAKC